MSHEHTISSSRPSKEKKVKVSSGRGGSGNIISMELTPDLHNEIEVLRRRRMEREDCEKYQKIQNSGRGGRGNIQSASTTQFISYDKSADPDDLYEDIVVERNKSTPKPVILSTLSVTYDANFYQLRTGRGGSGGLLMPSPSQTTLRSPSRLSLSSGSSSSRHSTISSTSSSYSSPLGHRSELSIFTRLSKNKNNQRDSTVSESSFTSSLPENSLPKNHNQWWKFQRSSAPMTLPPCQRHSADIPHLIINDCPENQIIEEIEISRFEEGNKESMSLDIMLPLPDLQASSSRPEEITDEEEVPTDMPDDDEDAQWELNVLIQAQSEIETPFLAS